LTTRAQALEFGKLLKVNKVEEPVLSLYNQFKNNSQMASKIDTLLSGMNKPPEELKNGLMLVLLTNEANNLKQSSANKTEPKMIRALLENQNTENGVTAEFQNMILQEAVKSGEITQPSGGFPENISVWIELINNNTEVREQLEEYLRTVTK